MRSPRPDTRRGLDTLARFVREREVEQIVVGLPLTMRGEEGEQARWTRRFAERLAERVDVPVVMHDERLTTRQAERSGGTAQEDSRAAAHLLEAFLMARRRMSRQEETTTQRRGARARAARARGASGGGARRAAAADSAGPGDPPGSRRRRRRPRPRGRPHRSARQWRNPRHRRLRHRRRSLRSNRGSLAPPRGPRSTLLRVVAVVGLVLTLFAGWFLFSLFQPFKGDGEGLVRVAIPTGATVTQIGDILEENGVIDSAFFFRARVTLGGSRGDLKPGHYHLKDDMSYSAAIDALSEGPPKNIVTVTIPEGRSRAEIGPIVEGAGLTGSYEASQRQRARLQPARVRGRRRREPRGLPLPGDLRAEAGGERRRARREAARGVRGPVRHR